MAVLRLKEIMKEKGISREELAQKVDVSMTTISNISTEKNYPTIPLLLSIAETLDVDVREMFVPTKGGTLANNEIKEIKGLLIKGLTILGE
nr:helix-turn-helix transcriptional regulator [uncultured Brumimicrobium sp.]